MQHGTEALVLNGTCLVVVVFCQNPLALVDEAVGIVKTPMTLIRNKYYVSLHHVDRFRDLCIKISAQRNPEY